MKYKGIAHVVGELKPRICYGGEYKTVADWVTQTLKEVPGGTVVELWEVKEVIIRQYTKPIEVPSTPPPS